jgi:hypothetical protein
MRRDETRRGGTGVLSPSLPLTPFLDALPSFIRPPFLYTPVSPICDAAPGMGIHTHTEVYLDLDLVSSLGG